jgi:hypothetical protein
VLHVSLFETGCRLGRLLQLHLRRAGTLTGTLVILEGREAATPILF